MKNDKQRTIIPLRYSTVQFDTGALHSFLQTVPAEPQFALKALTPVIGLPMPNGTTSYFHVWESSVMSPGLAARFPNLKSYTGQGITDSTARAKLEWNETGFHAMISSIGPTVFIEPYAKGTLTLYQSYYRNDLQRNPKDRQPDTVLKQ